MDIHLKEINEIPEKAEICYHFTKNLVLPFRVPYVGMGSSYYAALTLKYQGFHVYPDIASEYYNYLSSNKKVPLGVLVSQSGRSSETLWCRELFEKYIAITNYDDSPLATSSNIENKILLHAGPEEGSSTKTYINTLITLYNGCGIDTRPALQMLKSNLQTYQNWGRETAERLYTLVQQKAVKGYYIISNGPNIPTSYHGSIILSESTKLPFQAMAVSQYDHGPKETAEGSFVIAILTNGPANDRTRKLIKKISEAGAHTAVLEQLDLQEKYSPITASVALSYFMHYLSEKLGIEKTYVVGNKITEV
jgi:glucosamine--fructose-6-phosphate aminotransferase (isomerizing)